MAFIYTLYKLSLIFCAFYGLHRLILALTAFRFCARDPVPLSRWNHLPFVTIQLPLYNEYFVVHQLLKAASRLDYPRDRFEIQVLDDSTDETTAEAREAVRQMKANGINISLIHRQARDGFKAGALAHGLKSAKGEYVAVFDADFVLPSDFIKKTIDFFTDPSIGMVQVRWAHQNAHESILTRLQSVLIDGHFLIDQFARYHSGRFFNFNGSAGIWRRGAIDDAGGWEADTLAEDLDLSYRAQIKGWKFVLLSDYQVRQELPTSISAFRHQQFRWSKGSLQVGLKMLPKIWTARLPLSTKCEATFHLTNTFAYIFVLLTSLLILPIVLTNSPVPTVFNSAWVDLALFITGIGSLTLYFFITEKRQGPDWFKRLWFLPIFISGFAGLSLVYIKAALEVLFQKKTPFVRTPKRGPSDGRHTQPAYRSSYDPLLIAEISMAIYLTVVLFTTVIKNRTDMTAFLLIIILGYYYVIFMNLTEIFQAWPVLKTIQPAVAAPVLPMTQKGGLAHETYVHNLLGNDPDAGTDDDGLTVGHGSARRPTTGLTT